MKLVEELLLDADLPLRDWGPRRIPFHGHCHQKALAGTAATVALLERIPGAEVVELDAGCCGMAGSFGFEAEHYELSMRIGGMRLFPAVRLEPAETLIAATGVSCRQQIAHGTAPRDTPCRSSETPSSRRESRVSGSHNHPRPHSDLPDRHLSPINMGLLGIVAAFVVGTAAGVSRTTSSPGSGELFVILVGVTYLFAIATTTARWTGSSTPRCAASAAASR